MTSVKAVSSIKTIIFTTLIIIVLTADSFVVADFIIVVASISMLRRRDQEWSATDHARQAHGKMVGRAC